MQQVRSLLSIRYVSSFAEEEFNVANIFLIWQFINPATLKIALPASYDGDSPHNLEVPGTLFNESTFISEP
jgi:hypothetical protein